MLIARLFASRKRMLAAVAAGLLVGWLMPQGWGVVTRGLVGWNAGVWLYLALVAHMTMDADHGVLKSRAIAHADGASVVLAVVVLAAIVSLSAVVAELSTAKGAGTRAALPHLLLALFTVVGSWVLVPTLFMMNYASLYHLPTDEGSGLLFPSVRPDAGTPFHPDYGDFAYFAFTIAVASQTADVAVSSRPMRRLVLVQALLSFAFNTTVLALGINLAAGLI